MSRRKMQPNACQASQNNMDSWNDLLESNFDTHHYSFFTPWFPENSFSWQIVEIWADSVGANSFFIFRGLPLFFWAGNIGGYYRRPSSKGFALFLLLGFERFAFSIFEFLTLLFLFLRIFFFFGKLLSESSSQSSPFLSSSSLFFLFYLTTFDWGQSGIRNYVIFESSSRTKSRWLTKIKEPGTLSDVQYLRFLIEYSRSGLFPQGNVKVVSLVSENPSLSIRPLTTIFSFYWSKMSPR